MLDKLLPPKRWGDRWAGKDPIRSLGAPLDRSLSPPFSSGVLLPESWELYAPKLGILMLDWGLAPGPPVPPPTERVLEAV